MSIIILLYSREIRQNNKNMISSDTSEYFRLGVKKFRLLFKEHRKNETEKKHFYETRYETFWDRLRQNG